MDLSSSVTWQNVKSLEGISTLWMKDPRQKLKCMLLDSDTTCLIGLVQFLRSDWSCFRWEGGVEVRCWCWADCVYLRISAPLLLMLPLDGCASHFDVRSFIDGFIWFQQTSKHDRYNDFRFLPDSQYDYRGPDGCAKRTMRRCPGSEPSQERESGRSFQYGPGPGDENHRHRWDGSR